MRRLCPHHYELSTNLRGSSFTPYQHRVFRKAMDHESSGSILMSFRAHLSVMASL